MSNLKRKGWGRWQPRLSIRHKLLGVNAALLLAAIGTYLLLATSLFTKDKLAYVYDLQSSLIETLTEQTEASITILEQRLSYFASEIERQDFGAEQRNQTATKLFTNERDLLRVQVFRVDQSGPELSQAFVNREALDEAGIQPRDLEETTNNRELPLAAIANGDGDPLLRNSSLPPDAAILTLVARFESATGRGAVVADFRHQRLLRLFGRSHLHVTMLVDAQGHVIAHPDAAAVIKRSDLSKAPLVRDALDSAAARGVKEYGDQGVAKLGAFGHVGVAGMTIITEIPKQVALSASDELVTRSSRFAIAILLGTFVVIVLFSRMITAPIRRLSAATIRIGEGDLDIDIDSGTADEIGDLARAFKEMTSKIKQTQAQLVHSEKMSAFGQLGAGVTHELKNPIAGIVGLAETARRKPDNKALVAEFLELIEKEGRRCLDILDDFLMFARREEQTLKPLDLTELITDGIKLVKHQLNVNNVNIQTNFSAEPIIIHGSPGALQQVLTNLAINAQHAMSKGGTLVVGTSIEGDSGVLTVSDNGEGIAPEALSNIFDPFFTTKSAGEGTGLGLSVTFSIIEQHRGTIDVTSEVGKGTTFTIRLPLVGDTALSQQPDPS